MVLSALVLEKLKNEGFIKNSAHRKIESKHIDSSIVPKGASFPNWLRDNKHNQYIKNKEIKDFFVPLPSFEEIQMSSNEIIGSLFMLPGNESSSKKKINPLINGDRPLSMGINYNNHLLFVKNSNNSSIAKLLKSIHINCLEMSFKYKHLKK